MMTSKCILLLSVLFSVSIVGCLSVLQNSPPQAALLKGGRLENNDTPKGHFITKRMTDDVDFGHNAPCQIHQRVLRREDFTDSPTQNIRDISAPSIPVTYCAGHCHFPIPRNVNRTQNGNLQSVLAFVTGQVPYPCCAPAEFIDVQYPTDEFIELKDTSAKLDPCCAPNELVDACRSSADSTHQHPSNKGEIVTLSMVASCHCRWLSEACIISFTV